MQRQRDSYTYYLTCPAGLQAAVKGVLNSVVPDAAIIRLYEGLVLFQTRTKFDKLPSLPFASNVFLVLRELSSEPENAAAAIINRAISSPAFYAELRNMKFPNKKTFRIVVSELNTLVSGPRTKKRLEALVAAATGLRINAHNPDTEFWIYVRSEGIAFLSLRLTQRKGTESNLLKGELKPEISEIMCRLSEPSEQDVVLDPFCGRGSIIIQRAQLPFKTIIASDTNQDLVKDVKQRVGRLFVTATRRRIIVRCDDALDLCRYKDGTLKKIVTDPPWSLYEDVEGGPSLFYPRMLREFARVVMPLGLIIVLTAQKSVMMDSICQLKDMLSLVEHYDLLVSGNKCGLYKVVRTSTAFSS